MSCSENYIFEKNAVRDLDLSEPMDLLVWIDKQKTFIVNYRQSVIDWRSSRSGLSVSDLNDAWIHSLLSKEISSYRSFVLERLDIFQNRFIHHNDLYKRLASLRHYLIKSLVPSYNSL
jgi:hypothetical protein